MQSPQTDQLSDGIDESFDGNVSCANILPDEALKRSPPVIARAIAGPPGESERAATESLVLSSSRPFAQRRKGPEGGSEGYDAKRPGRIAVVRRN
jgi:hypothetical protein